MMNISGWAPTNTTYCHQGSRNPFFRGTQFAIWLIHLTAIARLRPFSDQCNPLFGNLSTQWTIVVVSVIVPVCLKHNYIRPHHLSCSTKKGISSLLSTKLPAALNDDLKFVHNLYILLDYDLFTMLFISPCLFKD